MTGYLPNGVHAVEAMLAAASIGAIWSSTSPDFGVNVSWGSYRFLPLGVRPLWQKRSHAVSAGERSAPL